MIPPQIMELIEFCTDRIDDIDERHKDKFGKIRDFLYDYNKLRFQLELNHLALEFACDRSNCENRDICDEQSEVQCKECCQNRMKQLLVRAMAYYNYYEDIS